MAPGEWLSSNDYACLEAVQHALRRRHGFDLAAADVCSIGATLYELLTRELPVPPPQPEGGDEPEEGSWGRLRRR